MFAKTQRNPRELSDVFQIQQIGSFEHFQDLFCVRQHMATPPKEFLRVLLEVCAFVLSSGVSNTTIVLNHCHGRFIENGGYRVIRKIQELPRSMSQLAPLLLVSKYNSGKCGKLNGKYHRSGNLIKIHRTSPLLLALDEWRQQSTGTNAGVNFH